MSFHFGNPSTCQTFDELLALVPNGEFRKVTRSTVPLLAFWSDEKHRKSLFELLGVHQPTETTFEYAVPASCTGCKSKGRGKASFTDVMAFTPTAAVAIEAKYTEPLYETVKKWMSKSKSSENRQAVLDHWLLCCLKSEDPVPGVDDLVYQFVHRAASARRAADEQKKERAIVVHLLFDEKSESKYNEASNLAAKLLTKSGPVEFKVVVAHASHGVKYAGLAEKSESEAPDAIRDALRDGADVYRFVPFSSASPRTAGERSVSR